MSEKAKPCLFADDTNLTASGDSIQDVQAAANSNLENLRKCLVARRPSLNVAKTEFILIGSKPMLKKTSYPHTNVHIENISKLNKFMNFLSFKSSEIRRHVAMISITVDFASYSKNRTGYAFKSL